MSIVAHVLIVLAAAATATDPSPGEATTNPGVRYESCLAQVDIDAKAAVSVASAWAESGGGVPARHCEALALIRLERPEEAGNVLIGLGFDQSVTDLDVRADLLAQAGNAYLLAHRGEKAKKALDGAIELKPGDPDLLIDRARASALDASWAPAIADLNAAIGIVPERAEPYVLRASAKRQSGDAYEAKKDLELALMREPDNLDALLERGLLQSTSDPTAARADFESIIAKSPDSSSAATAKAELEKLK